MIATEARSMADAEFGWKEALRGVAGLLEKMLERAHAAGVPPAKAQVNVSDLLVLVKRHGENPPLPFATPDVGALQAEIETWKQGVRDANRIAQEHAARADRAERELEATRPSTDALYDVLGAARAFMAAELLLERAALADSTTFNALRHERNEALQRLRDTLAEHRPALLRAAKERP